jgi:membrane protease subunit HflK
MSEHEHKHVPLPTVPDEPEGEGPKFGKAHNILLFFAAAAAVVWLLSGFYQVKADEIAIIERLGRYVGTEAGGRATQIEQGLHYRLPWPIDTVHKISVQQTATLAVDTFDKSPDAYIDMKTALQRQQVPAEVISAIFDPYIITGDKSVLHMNISVIYRINDPEAWLSTFSHSSEAAGGGGENLRAEIFQQIVQHAMIRVASKMTLQQLLFSDIQMLPAVLQGAIQEEMQLSDPDAPEGKRGFGIQVQKVDIGRVRTPERVRRAFDEVVQARAGRDTAISRAQADADAAVTRAKGQQTTLIVDAEAYRKVTVEAARGETNRFREVMVQYNNAPDVTRWNVFVDAARTVSANARRIVFAQPGQRTVLTVEPPQFDPGQGQPRQ